MNCINHQDREATSKCSICGKPLCSECAEMTSMNICTNCFHKSIRKNAHEERSMPKPTILFVMFAIAAGFILNLGVTVTVALIVLALLIPSGYISQVNLDRSKFVKIQYVGELLFYLCKIVLSPFIGIIAFPKYCFLLLKNKTAKEEVDPRLL